MIRYALICAVGHEFDGWFRDSGGFDAQAAECAIVCPICRSAQVTKAVMAPFVARTDAAAPKRPACESDRAQTELTDDDAARLRAAVRGMRAAVLAATEDVGERFASEARRIRDGEAEARPIRGKAELEEAKKLVEEDIAIWLLPDDSH